MATFLGALVICMLLHLMAIAAAGVMCGVSIRVFSIGFGPRIYSRGRFRICLIPSGGYVKFLDSSEEEVSEGEMHKAFDRQSLAKKIAICLSGCATMAGISFALSGPAAWGEMALAPFQFFAGGVSPLNEARALINAASAFVQRSGFIAVLSIVAAKHCALNAMPLTALNGGDAVAAIARHLGLVRWWPARATLLLFFCLLSVFLSWVFAIGAYMFTS